MTSILKKITIKTLGFGVKDIRKLAESGKGEPMTVARIFGRASGTKTGESDNGPWTSLSGQFKAVNAVDGKEYMSGNLFMPDVAMDLVAPALAGEGDPVVDVALDILVVEDESSVVGYQYQAQFHIQPETAGIDAVIEGLAMPALPAPAATEEKKGAK